MEEHENQYAYQVMCFMDILGNNKDKLNADCSEDLFSKLSELIEECNTNDNNLTADRYTHWENFIRNKIGKNYE
jgi:hypothetical protein|tara:strand:- start:344 stop:565 length:222 start_codon:yes stop_codon:yes gene_type:complete